MRTQSRRLTLDELARVADVSEALFEADTNGWPVEFTYTKDTGESSVRTGFPNGVFGQENKTSLYLTDENGENGKTFNVRCMTDLSIVM
jgi:hypothetical protein